MTADTQTGSWSTANTFSAVGGLTFTVKPAHINDTDARFMRAARLGGWTGA